MKLHSHSQSRVAPSLTTDDGPSPSASRRDSASASPPGWCGLGARRRTAETPDTPRPRKNPAAQLGKKIRNLPHSIAVCMGISESRRAAEARRAQAQPRPEGNPVPPEPHAPTEPSAMLSQDALFGRSPTISSLRSSQSSLMTDFASLEGSPCSLDTPARRSAAGEPSNQPPANEPPSHRDTLPSARLETTTGAQPQHARTRVPRVRAASLDSGTAAYGRVERRTPREPLPPLRWISRETPPANERPTRPVTEPHVRRAPRPQGEPPQPAASLARAAVSAIGAEGPPPRDGTRHPPTLPVPSGRVQPQPPHAPETVLEVVIQSPPAQHPARPSRRDAVMAALRQAARKVHLPQAGQAVADASITRAIGSTVDSFIGSPVRGGWQVASTMAKAANNWWSKERMSSAGLQQALTGEGVDLGKKGCQSIAHAYAVDYGESAATFRETVEPLLHQILKIGGAGTAMAFGVGRNSGMAAGDALGRVMRGAPQAPGLGAGPELPAAAMSGGTAFRLGATGLLQWALGSLTGAAGNMAGQYLAAPLVNLIPRQFQPIDHRAVLPDETVELMNRLKDGAGDALRRQVQEAQSDIARIDSASNVLLGQIAFDVLTGVRFAIQGGLPLGAMGQMGAGLAASAPAGMAIGAVMATRQSVASQQIPDIEKLREAVAAHGGQSDSDRAAALDKVSRNAVPLFFPMQVTPPSRPQPPGDIETGEPMRNADAAERGRLAGMLETAKWAVQAVSGPVVQALSKSLGSSPLIEPAVPGKSGSRLWNNVSNVAASYWNRTTEMADATKLTSLMSTLANMLASTTEGPARHAILAVLNMIGIHFAVRPWFDGLAVGIGQFDNGVRDHRQEVASRRAGT